MAAARARTRRRVRARARPDPLARERALEALSRMRADGLSLTRAARAASTTVETVRRFARSALRRKSNGRYEATPSDRLTRRMNMLTESGPVEVVIRNSRTASRIASYMSAVDKYLKTGNRTALAEFEGKSVRARGLVFEFVTNPDALDRLGQAGEVSFERLYTRR